MLLALTFCLHFSGPRLESTVFHDCQWMVLQDGGLKLLSSDGRTFFYFWTEIIFLLVLAHRQCSSTPFGCEKLFFLVWDIALYSLLFSLCLKSILCWTILECSAVVSHFPMWKAMFQPLLMLFPAFPHERMQGSLSQSCPWTHAHTFHLLTSSHLFLRCSPAHTGNTAPNSVNTARALSGDCFHATLRYVWWRAAPPQFPSLQEESWLQWMIEHNANMQ